MTARSNGHQAPIMSLNPNKTRSFSQRAAALGAAVESWDDDGDFHGELLTTSLTSNAPSMSSRFSTKSESVAGDDPDWRIHVAPNDERSTSKAISSAKQAGVPIPANVPSSALLGGSIKRLGKKSSAKKIRADDDWGNDLDLPSLPSGGLKLRLPQPKTPATEQDELEDWGEGSLGIRFAGTRRGEHGRSSSISAMSPSMGSVATVESDDDGLNGLVLPNEPLDFKARLNKLKEMEREPPNAIPSSPAPREPQPSPTAERKQPGGDEDDFFAGIDVGSVEVVDPKKQKLNRNLKIQTSRTQPSAPRAAATTLTFTDKPTVSKIPRPLNSTKPSRLDPVYESGVSQGAKQRSAATTTNAQLLRAKRSAPALRNPPQPASSRPPVPFLPAGSKIAQSGHVPSRPPTAQPRRDSDPNRQNMRSPAMRSYSRMSSTQAPDTPSRTAQRRDLAPAALAREAAAKRTYTKPARRRNYGDGSELEVFDDLPTSATKESKFVKQPTYRGSQKSLRHQPSNTRLPQPDRMATQPDRMATATPLPPPTPRSPSRMDNTPRFARDTHASRAAREARLREAGTRSRAEGPVLPIHTNWKAQVAARSPHNSPTTQRKKGTGQKPHLIRGMGSATVKNEKGMIYNPIMQRWEGNEGALMPFNHANHSTSTLVSAHSTPAPYTPTLNHYGSYQQLSPTTHHQHPYHHQHSHSDPRIAPQPMPTFAPPPVPRETAPSPPRAPALISHITTQRGVQVERGMVFDPRRMCWLKLSPPSRTGGGGGPLSPSLGADDDDDDPFAGLEDLKVEDEQSVGGPRHSASGTPGGPAGGPAHHSGAFSSAATASPPVAETSFVGEEFDLGPEFIRRQREEEAAWRRRVEGWIVEHGDGGASGASNRGTSASPGSMAPPPLPPYLALSGMGPATTVRFGQHGQQRGGAGDGRAQDEGWKWLVRDLARVAEEGLRR